MKKKKKRTAVTDKVTAVPKKKPNIGLLISVALTTACFFGFYRFMLTTPYFLWVLVAYMTALAVLALAYVIYNRGLVKITYDMLPSSMTDEQKNAYLADISERKRKSKWLLVFIFPLIFTFAFDAFSWFIEDNILSFFRKG